MAFTSFMFMGIFSSIWAGVRLSKPGVSREVRLLVLKRHVSYIIAYFLCNIYLLMQRIQKYRIDNNHDVQHEKWWINTSEILYYSQGMIIPSVRLVEPYFFILAWENIRNFLVRTWRLVTFSKYSEEDYDPLRIGAKFVNKSHVELYKESKKAKQLQKKYKTDDDFLLGIDEPAETNNSINDNENEEENTNILNRSKNSIQTGQRSTRESIPLRESMLKSSAKLNRKRGQTILPEQSFSKKAIL